MKEALNTQNARIDALGAELAQTKETLAAFTAQMELMGKPQRQNIVVGPSPTAAAIVSQPSHEFQKLLAEAIELEMKEHQLRGGFVFALFAYKHKLRRSFQY